MEQSGKYTSRKFWLAVCSMIAFVALKAFGMLGDAAFCTLCSIILSSYYIANSMAAKLVAKIATNKIEPPKPTETKNSVDEPEDKECD